MTLEECGRLRRTVRNYLDDALWRAEIAAVYFAEHQTNYCPAEQTGGRVLKDRRLSRLLK